MTGYVEHIPGQTFHGRKGEVENAFRYSVDYVLLDAEKPLESPGLFRRNGHGTFALWDKDHGGTPGKGNGPAWARAVLEGAGFHEAARIEILAQPRVMGHVFNPVSFWLIYDAGDALCAVIAEVTNTYGDRHCYLCNNPDFAPITREQSLTSQKVFHVSPFQPVDGGYVFRFDIDAERIGIWIDFTAGNGGLLATLTGPRHRLTNRAILLTLLRRPFGSRRVLGLIHWQAFKLWWKGAAFRARPEPPAKEVSQ